MNVPTPVLIAFIILIGWPLIQLASVLLVARQRAELSALASEMRSDPAFGEEDMRVLEHALKDVKGHPVFLLFPILVPIAVVAFSFADLFEKSPTLPPNVRDTQRTTVTLELSLHGDPIIFEDPRYRRVDDLATDIGFKRWPVTLILTVLIGLLTIPIYFVAYGLRSSWVKFTTGIMKRLTHSMRMAHRPG